MAIIAMSFAAVVLAFTVTATGIGGTIRDVPVWAHVGTATFLLVVSLLVRTGTPSMARLRALDTVAAVGGGIGFSLFTVGRAPTTARELVLLLFMAHMLMIRAALVPSSMKRTMWLSLLAVFPSALQAVVIETRPGDVLGGPLARLTLTFLWAGATTLASSLVSKRIYGLQRAITRARRLGPYTLEEKIGQGGMGEVYKARHALLRRPTAIKVVRDAGNPDTVARFEREVQLTSQLTHPNTVQVYDFGRAADGTFYYAMEHIEGLTLWQLITLDGPQCPGRVVSLLLQICASLAEAHALGLIHRDVKPDNVLVCVRGLVPDVVKVVDFGLARSMKAGGPDVPGMIMGTAQYMAPEAVRAPETIDARADLYSVGALAYFLLTGTELFHGATAVVLSQQMYAVPQRPSSRLGAELPAELERIVMRCLEKDADLRPQSALQLAAELQQTDAAQTWTSEDSAAWWSRNVGLVARARLDNPPKSGSRSVTARVADAS
jgi:serine/threonine-protein kinase